MHKVKVSRELASLLDFINLSNATSAEQVLKTHSVYPTGWKGDGEILNGLDYELLRQALTVGYEVEQSNLEPFIEVGMDVSIIKGFHKGKVLPVVQVSLEGEYFDAGDVILFNFLDEGEWFEIVSKRPEKTPHVMSAQVLELELDYELASLHDAMARCEQAEIDRSKKRLSEIHKELLEVKKLEESSSAERKDF